MHPNLIRGNSSTMNTNWTSRFSYHFQERTVRMHNFKVELSQNMCIGKLCLRITIWWLVPPRNGTNKARYNYVSRETTYEATRMARLVLVGERGKIHCHRTNNRVSSNMQTSPFKSDDRSPWKHCISNRTCAAYVTLQKSRSPLYLASGKGHAEMAKLLISKGARGYLFRNNVRRLHNQHAQHIQAHIPKCKKRPSMQSMLNA